jgi:hypothetical protein
MTRFVCRRCRVSLTEGNWVPARRTRCNHICNSCASKDAAKSYVKNKGGYVRRSHEYFTGHKNEIQRRTRDWKRKNELSGVRLQRQKREYPLNQKCELCHGVHLHLVYHHWNDSKPWIGLWCCRRRHGICEAVESDNFKAVVKEYKGLKTKLKKAA